MINLTIGHRLVLSVIAFIIIICVAVGAFLQSNKENIVFARMELIGNAYINPLVKLMNTIANYQLLKNSSASKEKLQQIETDIESLFQNLIELDQNTGTILKVTEQDLGDQKNLLPTALRDKWETLLNIGADPYSLIVDIQSLINYVNNTSNLILDPELASYWLVNTALVYVPETIIKTIDITSYIYPVLKSNLPLSEEEQRKLYSDYRFLEIDDYQNIIASTSTAITADQDVQTSGYNVLGASLDTSIKTYKEANSAFSAILEQTFNIQNQVKAEDCLNASIQNLNAVIDLYISSAAGIDAMLKARIMHYQNIILNVVAISVLGLVVAIFAYYFVIRSIISPIKVLHKLMLKMTSGTLDIAIPFLSHRDEIGEIASAVETFRLTSIKAKEMTEAISKEKSLKEAHNIALQSHIDKFDRHAHQIIEKFDNAIANLSHSVNKVFETAGVTNNTSKTVNSVAESTAQNVASVAAAAEELTTAISEISGQITQSSVVISNTVNKTTMADATVIKLTNNSAKIGEIVKIIRNIADQINLLALNATIESARAGEAGKGFAVVASEVKNLANQTAKSTEDISGQIAEMQAITKDVENALRDISASINNFNQIYTNITAAVEEQNVVTKDIARNAQITADGVQEVTNNITMVNKVSNEADNSAKELLQVSKELATQSEQLKEEILYFLQSIKV